MKIRGKVAVVTGGSGAIGSAIVRALANEGVRVISISRRKSQIELSALVSEVICDMADSAALRETLCEVQSREEVDILVNCVGIAPKSKPNGEKISIANVSLQEWNSLMDINLTSYLLCMQQFIPAMISKGSGRIINIASYVARSGGSVGAPHYVTSKAAVLGLTKVAAKEAAPNVTVNAINPGRIESPMTKDQPADIHAELLRRIPLGRMGRPEDIAGAVLYLASDLADYVTGAAIDVNGGIYIAS